MGWPTRREIPDSQICRSSRRAHPGRGKAGREQGCGQSARMRRGSRRGSLGEGRADLEAGRHGPLWAEQVKWNGVYKAD